MMERGERQDPYPQHTYPQFGLGVREGAAVPILMVSGRPGWNAGWIRGVVEQSAAASSRAAADTLALAIAAADTL